jgi:hypothetical protein
MRWLIKLFYNRYIFFDFKGDIRIDRYYLLFPPLNDFLSRLPNIWFHVFYEKTTRTPEVKHDHARWCVSVLLSGGYTEIRNGKTLERKALSISILKPRDVHQIISTEPNTKTLFFVGPRIGRIKFYSSESSEVIPKDQWEKVGITTGYDKETPELLNKLDRRRRAYAKLTKSKTLV